MGAVGGVGKHDVGGCGGEHTVGGGGGDVGEADGDHGGDPEHLTRC